MSSLLKTVRTSEDPIQEAKTITESLNPTNLKQLLNDPSLTYPEIRQLYDVARRGSSLALKKGIDIDQVILRNERYIRSRPTEANQDGRYLLRLKDLPNILPDSKTSSSGHLLRFVRAETPKGGLETFKIDPQTSKPFTIHATDLSFTKTFRRITKDILYGLDWNNVLLVGGMVHTTLLHTNSSSDSLPQIVEPDLDLYLYGLGEFEIYVYYSPWRNC